MHRRSNAGGILSTGLAPRVAAHERLGEEDELGTLARGLGGGRAEVVDGGGGLEGVVSGLNGGCADVGAVLGVTTSIDRRA